MRVIFAILLTFVFCTPYIVKDKKTKELKPEVFVIGDNVNLRSSPSINAKIIKKLKITEPVKILSEDKSIVKIESRRSSWFLVKTEDGGEGWIFGGYLSTYNDRNPSELLKIASRLSSIKPNYSGSILSLVRELPLKTVLDSFGNKIDSHSLAEELAIVNNCYKKGYVFEIIKDVQSAKSLLLQDKLDSFKKFGSCLMSIDTECESDGYPVMGPDDLKEAIFARKKSYNIIKIVEQRAALENSIVVAFDNREEIRILLQRVDNGYRFSGACQ